MALEKRGLTGAADACQRADLFALGEQTLRCLVATRRPLQLRDNRLAGWHRPKVVQQFDSMAAFHLAADVVCGLRVFESVLAHRQPLAFNLYLHVPRALVSDVFDVAPQTTCRPAEIGKVVTARSKAFNRGLLRAAYSPLFLLKLLSLCSLGNRRSSWHTSLCFWILCALQNSEKNKQTTLSQYTKMADLSKRRKQSDG